MPKSDGRKDDVFIGVQDLNYRNDGVTGPLASDSREQDAPQELLETIVSIDSARRASSSRPVL